MAKQKPLIISAIKANKQIRVSELFAGPVREFSIYNNKRTIPDGIDGFNNLNYLMPIGQFGSRLSPAAAADRYIYTDFNPIFRKIFLKEDDLILDDQEEDGDPIEPVRYLPVLPNVLINGADGMATGHATFILQYNPEDLKKYIINILKEKKQNIQLKPWFRGFKGTVEKNAETHQVTIKGKIERISSTQLRITELPIGVWEDNYKEYLNDLEDSGYIKSYDNNSSAREWQWDITVPRSTGYDDEDNLYKKFKLYSRATENLTVWLPTGKLKCFRSAEDLTDYFVVYRLSKYEDRRQAMLKMLTEKLNEQNEKLRFIHFYIANAEKFSKKTKADLTQLLTTEGFKLIDTLLDIRIYNLTLDQIQKLEEQIKETQKSIDFYNQSTATSLYLKDLDALDLTKELNK
jgi:DNA topoisomerase-2